MDKKTPMVILITGIMIATVFGTCLTTGAMISSSSALKSNTKTCGTLALGSTSLSGHVYNRVSHQPIEGVDVVIYHNLLPDSCTDTTDQSGYYYIEIDFMGVDDDYSDYVIVSIYKEGYEPLLDHVYVEGNTENVYDANLFQDLRWYNKVVAGFIEETEISDYTLVEELPGGNAKYENVHFKGKAYGLGIYNIPILDRYSFYPDVYNIQDGTVEIRIDKCIGKIIQYDDQFGSFQFKVLGENVRLV